MKVVWRSGSALLDLNSTNSRLNHLIKRPALQPAFFLIKFCSDRPDHGLLRGNELSDELNDEREDELDDETEPSDDCRELYADMLLDLAALIDELALLAVGVPENGSTGRVPPSGSIGAVVGARGAGVVVDGLIGVGVGACAKPIPAIETLKIEIEINLFITYLTGI